LGVRKITVIENVTLDGVMQAPGRSDEDSRGGFTHGGWALPYDDKIKAEAMGRGMAGTGALLLGRRTYEDFHKVWPHRTGNPFTGFLNNAQKYVTSRTFPEPLPWENSTLLAGDAVRAVARLKQQSGPDLAVLGSGELVAALTRANLVEVFVLLIHPLILGTGRHLFPDEIRPAYLELVTAVTTTTGVVIATYDAQFIG
jgi:dihydrofolate reductase